MWTVSRFEGTVDIGVVNNSSNKGKKKVKMAEYTFVVVSELLETCSN